MSKLTLEQLKAENPGLASAIDQAVNEAIAIGQQQERERCIALLPEHVDDPVAQYSIDCVRNGAPFGDVQKAQYMSLNMSPKVKAIREANTVADLIEKALGINHDKQKTH